MSSIKKEHHGEKIMVRHLRTLSFEFSRNGLCCRTREYNNQSRVGLLALLQVISTFLPSSCAACFLKHLATVIVKICHHPTCLCISTLPQTTLHTFKLLTPQYSTISRVLAVIIS